MLKTILTVVITVILLLLALNNSDHVTVHLLIGQAFQMRLIFVMLLCGAIGFIIRHFIGVMREEELKRRLLMERKKKARRAQPPQTDDKLDYDFEP